MESLSNNSNIVNKIRRYSLLLALVTNFLLGSLDANLKARKAQQTGMNQPQHLYWRGLPDFYKQEYPFLFAAIQIITPIGLKFTLSLSWMYVIYDLILAGAGNESLWYWWSQPLWHISQKQTFDGAFRPVSWFEYPDRAPWMNQMFWLRYFDHTMPENVTRKGLYRANIVALLLCTIIMLLNKLSTALRRGKINKKCNLNIVSIDL